MVIFEKEPSSRNTYSAYQMLYFLSVPYASLSNPQGEKNQALTTFIKNTAEEKKCYGRDGTDLTGHTQMHICTYTDMHICRHICTCAYSITVGPRWT